MKRNHRWYLAIGMAVLLVLSGCSGATGGAAEPLPPAEVKTLNDNGEITVVDVREPDEYAEGHIPGAVNIPFGSLDARLGDVSKDKQVVFVCTAGPLSRRALEDVRDQGFTDANNMDGGMRAWTKAGYELAQ
jgi:rhodanese-related sulfurtransferase